MNDGRIKFIHEGHLFVIFLFSFTNKFNTLSLSSVGNKTIEKVVSINWDQ